MVVGIAGLRNLEIATKFRETLSHLVLCDFDQNLVGENGFWQLFRQAITTTPNKEEFLEKLKELTIRNYIFDISSFHSGKISVLVYYNDHLKQKALKQSAEIMGDTIRKMSWFKKDEKFAFIKDLFSREEENFDQRGGVKVASIDLTKQEDLQRLTQLCTSRAYPPKAVNSVVVNLSNSLNFVLGRGHSEWNPDTGEPKREEIDLDKTTQTAEFLRTDFLEHLCGRNVYIIDSVMTHNAHNQYVRDHGTLSAGDLGHFHSAVVRPDDLLEYRFVGENPGAVDEVKFKRAAARISATSDDIDLEITEEQGVIRKAKGSKVATTITFEKTV